MAGYSPESFAVSVLNGLGKPVTPANIKALVGWVHAEGGHWHNSARYNPLNTTQPEPGAGNTGTQGNIKVYRTPQQGIQATIQTLRNGRYGGILAAFAKGNDPNAVANAIGASPWGTSASLIQRVIGSTPAPSSVPAALGTTTTRTTTTPGVDNSGTRQALFAQYIGSQSARHDPNALLNLFTQLGGARDTAPTSRVTTSSTPGGTFAPAAKGSSGAVAKFAGKPIAGWIAPILQYAKAHGWQGTVTSGYRSYAEQKAIWDRGTRPAAKPGTSNHEMTAFPGGAVDVTNAQQLSQILAGSPYRGKLVWAGAKDPVHFSHPHNGSY